ncbi:RTC4-like domain-containing protein [Aspergillus pseudotamarii]|uniref:Restriction of telomere capping protein 4 n=1 Tax=Aspergillus pseudotamarii TaxID=132259 RepID=A0A5N6SED8_ASPPS|nr:RTC4-like domain-containing protein [Aspergillus pseudotamarii]KAE8133032.1 RTC4-like domain-containing protein [Aspergillus pseudotamarii]
MVTPRPKPDSSYASNRLTRQNYHGQHLLSTFKDKEAPEPVTKPEPATDDEPVSSSEEETWSNAGLDDDLENERTPRRPGPTLEEKLAETSRENGTPSRTPRSKRGIDSPRAQRSSRKRTLKDVVTVNEENDNGDPFSECGWSSQGVKKHKAEYGSMKKRNSTVYSRKPSTPLQMDSPNAGKKIKNVDTESQKDDGFKVPKDIDIKSPPSKSRSSAEFKAPPPLPNDIVSSSSFAPSSAREPAIFDTDDDDASPLSSPLSELSETGLQDILLDEAGDAPKPKESLCPWCKEPVDPELLLRFQSQPKQRIREQQRFCDSHKKTAAEKEWHDKGYPAIDWDTFDDRIHNYFDDLETLLVPDSQSYYRNILDSTLKAGKAKNFRLTLEGDGLETISCGYYGTRGSGKMLQALTTHFSRKLRRLAASDHIVKSAGVVGYAQAVLVPELAVRLVKEDMGVSDEAARQILRDSIDLGEKLNFALNDKVPIPEELVGRSVDL